MLLLVLTALVSVATCQLAGGRNPIDPNSPYAQEIAQFTVDTLSARSDSPNRLRLVRVVSAETQVVAGTKVYLTLVFGPTNCAKNSMLSDSSCILLSSQQCSVEVFDQPWTSTRLLNSVSNCAASTRAVGGESGTVVDENMQGVAQFAMTQINAASNSLFQSVVLSVKSATTQVVAGTMYRITMAVATSQCRNNGESGTLANCPLQTNAQPQLCQVAVWERVWMTPSRQLVSYECAPASA